MSRTTLATTVTPGTATAVVGARAAALVDVAADDPRADPLLEAIAEGGGLREILDALAAIGLNQLPSFGVVVDEERGLRALSRGTVRVEITAKVPLDGSALSGANLHTWREVAVPGARAWELHLERDAADPLVPLSHGIVDADRLAGTVQADEADAPAGAPEGLAAARAEPPAADAAPGTLIDAVPSAPSAPVPPMPVPPDPVAPLSDDPYAAEPGTEPWSGPPAGVAPAEPVGAPVEAGAGWDDGAVDDPYAADAPHAEQPYAGQPYDADLDEPYDDGGSTAATGAVPATAGRLVWDSGRVIEVDGPILIGRNPPDGVIIDGVEALPFRVPDPDAVLSRQHLEVRVSGTEVFLVDKKSRNFTTIVRPGEPAERLLPGVPTLIPPGTVVALADVASFTLEADDAR